ncbi:MAG: ribonuclease G [Porticoccaceae bacterium]
MSVEILVNHSPIETRVATIDNGALVELAIERSQRRSFVGNIYRGKVVRVMPGMQAAFVDIGLDKAGFIHVDDLQYGEHPRENGSERIADVRQLVQEGQLLTVQVVKEPIGTKGARLTTHLSVSSRYLVYMPNVDHVGVSQRIEDAAERDRLREELLQSLASIEEGGDRAASGGGYILRTVADGASRTELEADARFVHRLWHVVRDKLAAANAPRCVYQDLSLPLRTLRDMGPEAVDAIRVDCKMTYQLMRRFAEIFNPDKLKVIEHYQSETPLFHLSGTDDEIAKALLRRVELKSGGYLVIDQTEAMTTVDVNTGGFIGHRDLEETIFKTNLEAAGTIARQLRLRNLGGIIIIDFIDMKDAEHRRQVLRILEKHVKNDHTRTSISGFSDLGLVEMTRKRTSENLQQMLCQPCPTCDGRGHLKSAQTVSAEILREVMRKGSVLCEKVLVLAAPAVIERMRDEDATHVADVEAAIERTLVFRVENFYSREQYDIIPV